MLELLSDTWKAIVSNHAVPYATWNCTGIVLEPYWNYCGTHENCTVTIVGHMRTVLELLWDTWEPYWNYCGTHENCTGTIVGHMRGAHGQSSHHKGQWKAWVRMLAPTFNSSDLHFQTLDILIFALHNSCKKWRKMTKVLGPQIIQAQRRLTTTSLRSVEQNRNMSGRNQTFKSFEKAMLMMLTVLIVMYYGLLNQLGNPNGRAVR